MIEMPQRSVTRFFVPMIDVLTLLLGIYLLMPIVKSGDRGDAEQRALEERNKQLQKELEAKGAGAELPAKLREEIDKLRREKIEALRNRLAVRVLEVDAATGKLYYLDPGRVEVRDQADANRLVERDRQAQGVSRRELYYLILYPRERASAYPTVEQRQSFDRWFEGVALGYDIPGVAPGRDKK